MGEREDRSVVLSKDSVGATRDVNDGGLKYSVFGDDGDEGEYAREVEGVTWVWEGGCCCWVIVRAGDFLAFFPPEKPPSPASVPFNGKSGLNPLEDPLAVPPPPEPASGSSSLLMNPVKPTTASSNTRHASSFAQYSR